MLGKAIVVVKSKSDRRSRALHVTAQGATALTKLKRLAAADEQHVEEKIGKASREGRSKSSRTSSDPSCP